MNAKEPAGTGSSQTVSNVSRAPSIPEIRTNRLMLLADLLSARYGASHPLTVRAQTNLDQATAARQGSAGER